MKNADKNLYSMLGVMSDATQAELRVAYRNAAMKNHPDRFVSYAQILWATRRMQDLNYAYSVLRDPAKRRAYDEAHPIPPARHSKNTTKATPPPAPKKFSRDDIIFNTVGYTVWLIATAILTYFQADSPHSKSIGSWMLSFLATLCITPFLFISLASVLVLPVIVVAAYFSKAYSAKKHELHRVERHHIWRDLFIRVILLCVVVSGMVFAFRWGINSDILYLILLGWMCGILGELAAMILWVTRVRKVVAETFALLKIDG